jgi:2-oxo-4-hydroxy-4-carboxy-5-ureidoimidazoline decarboxylase
MSQVEIAHDSAEARQPTGSGPLRLEEFNRLSPEAARDLLRPCLDVDRWISALVDHRPYRSIDELMQTAQTAADPLTEEEVEGALAHHPRIGQRAEGGSAEAALSRSEQAGLTVDEDVQRRLRAGNEAYEERFGRVFLIRAAGRSAEEILQALESRLTNDEETERAIVADQLRQIALLRLAGAVAP